MLEKLFLHSGIKNDEDHDQIDSDKPNLDQTVMGSFEEVHASGNTPVSIIGAFCFIAWAHLLVFLLVTTLLKFYHIFLFL
jgi:hypothetical protein